VLPESLGTPGVGRTNWDGVKHEASTTRDALAGAGLDPGSGTRFVVSAHSAGGRALAAAMSGGTLKADQLVLLDCLYEKENAPGAFSAILKAVKAGGLAEVKDVVVVPTGTYPPARDEQLLAAAGGRARLEKFVPRPGLSNHNAAARNNLVPRASW
jgi:predicted O-methyltransferase YrrM